MGEPNDQLRRERERTESPYASGDCLSRQELAELVNAWVHEHKNRVIKLNAGYVGTLEQGTIRRPRRGRTTVDNRFGSGFVRETVNAQLGYCVTLLNARCPGPCPHDDDWRIVRFVLCWAEEAGDWSLRARILSNSARQALWFDDPDTALTFIELALVRADRLTATEQGRLHTIRAGALAELGRAEEAATAVGVAVRGQFVVEALDGAGTLRSRRAADGLRELCRFCAYHVHFPEVADLRHRIGTVLPT